MMVMMMMLATIIFNFIRHIVVIIDITSSIHRHLRTTASGDAVSISAAVRMNSD